MKSKVLMWLSLSFIGFYIAFDKAHSTQGSQVLLGILIMGFAGVGLYQLAPGKRFFTTTQGITLKDGVFSLYLLIGFFGAFEVNDVRNQYLIAQQSSIIPVVEKSQAKACNMNGFCRDVCRVTYDVNYKHYQEDLKAHLCNTDFEIQYALKRPDVFVIKQ